VVEYNQVGEVTHTPKDYVYHKLYWNRLLSPLN